MKQLLAFIFAITPAFVVAAQSDFDACREKLIKSQKLDVLYDLKWNGKRSPRVVVGPTFFRMPIDAKEGFAETVSCFLVAGQQGKLINFDLLDWRTGKPVGAFTNGKYRHY